MDLAVYVLRELKRASRTVSPQRGGRLTEAYPACAGSSWVGHPHSNAGGDPKAGPNFPRPVSLTPGLLAPLSNPSLFGHSCCKSMDVLLAGLESDSVNSET